MDDMFVIGDEFFEIEYHMGRGVGIRKLLSTTLRVVGPSITLTSITNAAGFLLSAVIPIPAIRNFAIQVEYFYILASYLVCVQNAGTLKLFVNYGSQWVFRIGSPKLY